MSDKKLEKHEQVIANELGSPADRKSFLEYDTLNETEKKEVEKTVHRVSGAVRGWLYHIVFIQGLILLFVNMHNKNNIVCSSQDSRMSCPRMVRSSSTRSG